MDSKTFKIIDSYGKELEYEILLAFKWFKTGNNYLVYTDNTNDEDGNLKEEYSGDGLHLNGDGYNVVTDVLKNYLD